MIRLPARLAPSFALALALAAATGQPLAAQQDPGSFTLPTETPTPSPAPAGPADERAGVAIPPRTAPTTPPLPVAPSTPTPVPLDLPAPQPAARTPEPAPSRVPAPAPGGESARPARTGTPSAAPVPAQAAPAGGSPFADVPSPPTVGGALASPGLTLPQETAPAAPVAEAEPEAEAGGADRLLPKWWPYAAGALGVLALLGGGMLAWRRRPGVLRLAAPPSMAEAAPATDLPRIDLTLEITGATRSVMMFTLNYRVILANRSERAACDLALAVQLACARAAPQGNGTPAGAAQALARIERIGPHQARSIAGEVQLPLAAVLPLRQGSRPLFVPLVHITIESESQRALTRSFVIGTPSASGAARVHPIPLDQPPGTVPGLIAQPIAVPAVPPASAAA